MRRFSADVVVFVDVVVGIVVVDVVVGIVVVVVNVVDVAIVEASHGLKLFDDATYVVAFVVSNGVVFAVAMVICSFCCWSSRCHCS